jgi:hypothetical protein
MEIIYIVVGLIMGFIGAAMIIIWPPIIVIYALVAIGVVIDGILQVFKHGEER